MCAAAAETPEAQQRLKERAVASLRTAVAEGHKDLTSLKTDPELASLRETPSYQSLLAGLKR
jgi:hypothetical protein